MPNTVIVGAQWGDEGKGKIIDLLTEASDYVIRYQGGNNAGHTVVHHGREFVLHLVPCGIFHPGKICVIGNGVVVDPKALLDEIAELKGHRIQVEGNLFVSDAAHLIFPYHKILDQLREARRGAQRIGTTGRGIGPCYADKVTRIGIRIADLFNDESFAKKLKANLDEKNEIFQRVYQHEGFRFEEIAKAYLSYRDQIKPYVTNTTRLLQEAVKQEKSLLFEGAQGTLLDIDFGTYPFVTSSNAIAGGATSGTGIAPTQIDRIIGVVKAYTTRVGEGPFPSEFPPDLMEVIRTKGKEFGATTGRPRRCGWFDSVIVRHAILVNDIHEIAVTKLDVLDDLATIKIATAYRDRGQRHEWFPSDIDILSRCEVEYEEHPGWLQDTTASLSYGELPPNARKYLQRLGQLLGVKLSIISVGSRREQTLYVGSDPSRAHER